MSASRTGVAPAGGRDLRIDFFRGLALAFIFLDHIPSNSLSWLTIRNFGFSDATEIFVFLSGFSAALAYGGRLDGDGTLLTSARILKRCWQLYVAQLLLFLAFTAQIAYTATHFDNPMFAEEMKIGHFLNEPQVTLLQAMALKFRPANTDILPLYIVLIGAFPLLLIGLKRRPCLTLAGSLALYAAARLCGWNLPIWPTGVWMFNPLRWQLLFVLGTALALWRARLSWPKWVRRPAAILSGFYLLVALAVALSWRSSTFELHMPTWLEAAIYPIDKTNLDPLRLLHFLALAYLVVLAVPPGAGFLRWRVADPLVRCGQHSLEIFCLGIFLSFTGHMVLIEISASLAAQIGVSLTGLTLMALLAYYLSWYKRAEKSAAAARTSRSGAANRLATPPRDD